MMRQLAEVISVKNWIALYNVSFPTSLASYTVSKHSRSPESVQQHLRRARPLTKVLLSLTLFQSSFRSIHGALEWPRSSSASRPSFLPRRWSCPLFPTSGHSRRDGAQQKVVARQGNLWLLLASIHSLSFIITSHAWAEQCNRMSRSVVVNLRSKVLRASRW
jgi:hypothetical protein